MPRTFKIPKPADPWLLVLLVAATRIPFFAKTLFEFDSMNYAIALFRFDLMQETPHFPGYLLHVGIAQLLLYLTHNVNDAYVLESFLLSIGSVLLVWYAVRLVAGRAMAFGAAAVWAFNPIFWFYGCVATVYPHEAFFTAAVAAIGVRYGTDALRQRSRMLFPFLMAAAIGVAGAARPTSVLFFTPAMFVLLWRLRAPLRVWIGAIGIVGAISLTWFGILLAYAGGIQGYIDSAHHAPVLKDNSIFLNGTIAHHAAMIGKILLYTAIGTAPLWTLLCYSLMRASGATFRIIKRGIVSPAGMFLTTMAIVPFAFYNLIFWAKPGYLLNILAVSAIVAGTLYCRLQREGVVTRFWRWALVWSLIWIVYFIVPLPGKSVDEMRREVAVGSTVYETTERYPSLYQKISTAAVKLFTYASSAGIAAFDGENTAILSSLQKLPSPPDKQVIIATQWGQWAMFYQPHATVYDLSLFSDKPALVFRGHEMVKREVADSVITIPPDAQDVVIQIWKEHWAFPAINAQVHLEQLPTMKYVDEWRITDSHFRFTIGGKTFVR